MGPELHRASGMNQRRQTLREYISGAPRGWSRQKPNPPELAQAQSRARIEHDIATNPPPEGQARRAPGLAAGHQVKVDSSPGSMVTVTAAPLALSPIWKVRLEVRPL
jgi:hypothetical protein